MNWPIFAQRVRESMFRGSSVFDIKALALWYMF